MHLKSGKPEIFSIGSVLSIIIFFVLAMNSTAVFAWDKEDYPAIRNFVNTVGNIYFWPPEISFVEVGEKAKQNRKDLWPFEKEEANERYCRITKKIMGVAFEEVEDLSCNPLRINLSVYIINEKEALCSIIGIKIYRIYQMVRWEDGKGFIKEIPVVVWENQYMYIDEDYLLHIETSRYSFSETIDKYFKEFLNNFVNKISYFKKAIK